MLLTEWVARRGGVVHSADARAAGFSARAMAGAVASGALRRVRRSWLVSPNCDAAQLAAASAGGRVTCITAAQRHGLWVPDHDDVHIAVPRSRSRSGGAGVRLHWAQGPVATSATAAEDPPLNVLFHLARCLPRRDALMVWESAIRQQKVSRAALRRVQWRSTRAAELAQAASALSDSGLETAVVDGLRPYALPLRQQVWLLGHPVDVLIGERLVIQIDGFGFHVAADRRRDIAHDAELTLRGYTVLRFDYFQILFEWESVLERILTAVAQGLHLAQ
jgi:very-short-patch-repair endonuclease